MSPGAETDSAKILATCLSSVWQRDQSLPGIAGPLLGVPITDTQAANQQDFGVLKLISLLEFQTSQVPPGHLPFLVACFQGTDVAGRLMCLSSPLANRHLSLCTGLCAFVGLSQLLCMRRFLRGPGF